MNFLHPLPYRLATPLIVSVALAGTALAQDFGPDGLLGNVSSSFAAVGFADVDGDGDEDFLSASSNDGLILWSPNGGGGRFGAARVVGNGGLTLLSSIIGADFDGDGEVDIMVTEPTITSPSGIRIYRNLGGGSFDGQSVVVSASNVANHGTAADLDGDGVLDLLYAADTGNVTWARGLGGMTFAPDIRLSNSPSAVSALLAEDLDGDGDLDCIWSIKDNGRIEWVENIGAGAFMARAVLSTDVASPSDLEVVDLDGDGDLDLLAPSTTEDRVVWLENLGGATYGMPQIIAGLVRAGATTATDLDGDGDLDVLTAGGNTLIWSENQGGGTFASGVTLGASIGNSSQIAAPDIDGDGDPDPFEYSQEASWVPNLGVGAFGSQRELSLSTRGIFSMTPADLDSDGDMDLVGVDPITFDVVGLFDVGDGLANQLVTLGATPGSAFAVTTADMDGDGVLDLVVSGGSSAWSLASVYLFRGLGGGTFGPADLLHQTAGERGGIAHIADLEGDGDLDILMQFRVLSALGLETAQWLRNDGAGAYAPMGGSPSLLYAVTTRPLDVDGDGDADVVAVRHRRAGTAAFWDLISVETLAGGVLGDEHIIHTYNGPVDIALELEDLDGDGNLDLLVLDARGLHLEAFMALAQGGFAPPIVAGPAPPGAQSLSLADIDGDGDRDALIYSRSFVYWSERVGDSSFWIPDHVDGLGSYSVQGADLDADGDVDLLKASIFGTVIQLNQRRFGVGYCLGGASNSTGEAARITAAGSASVAAGTMSLVANDLPPGQFGFFAVGNEAALPVMPSGSQGALCLGGAIGRIIRSPGDIFLASGTGSATVALDLTALATPLGTEVILAGDTRYFQGWFRDVNPSATSNFTNALRVRFRP